MFRVLQLLAATSRGDGDAQISNDSDDVAADDEIDDVVDADDLVRSILGGLAFPVLVTDARGTVTHANEDAAALFGRDAGALVGQHARGVYDAASGDDLLSRTLETGERFEEVEDTFKVGGREVPVSRSVVPITCAKGTVRGAMTIDRDITERMELHEREAMLASYQRDVMDRLRRNLVKMGEGDLTIDPTVPTPPDDFEAMTDVQAEFEEMAANLSAAVEQVQTSLVSSRRRANRLQSVSQEMSAVSQQTAAAIDEIGESSDRIADAAERQVARATDAESNIASLSASIEEITASTQEMEALSEGAVGVAREGAQNGRTAVREIRDANEASEKNIEMIRSLEEQMGTINEMADMISDISDQVHLLALNANIEAARAGEDGHGFTVVANEVKSLAEKSSDAVSQISGTLDELKAGITETSETIADGNEQVRTGVEAVEDVSEASNEVSGGIQQVAAGIDEQAEAAENVVEAAVEVGGTSQEMLEMLEQFRLADDETARLED